MYQFILNMWIMRRYAEAQVNLCVTKGFITDEQKNAVLSSPQIPQ